MKRHLSELTTREQDDLLDFLWGERFESCRQNLHLCYRTCIPDIDESAVVYENAMLTNQVITEPVYSWPEKITRWIGRVLHLATLARFHEKDPTTTCDFVAERVYRIGG